MNTANLKQFTFPSKNTTKDIFTVPAPRIFDTGNNPILDTLAQLRKGHSNPSEINGIEKLTKRAKSKYFTGRIAIELADLKNSHEQYYRNAYYCNNTLLQINDSVTAKYCNSRLCNTCNRIRTAKMINGYTIPLNELNDKRLLTLTIPNVSANDLPDALSLMQKAFRSINDLMRKRKMNYGGLRKLEITYNAVTNTFHPHSHIITNGEDNANFILSEWMKRFPKASRKAQDIREVNEGSMIELFKYATKVVSKDINGTAGIYIKPVDVIMRALYKKRIIQPFGSIKKYVPEDIEELQKQSYPGIPEYDCIEWHWQESDWMNEYGELLTGYVPSEAVQRIKIISDTRNSYDHKAPPK